MPQELGQRFSRAEVAQQYDRFALPRIMAPWARELLDTLKPQPAWALLDVACGPGTVTREAARRLGPEGRVLGLDISGAMVEVARAKPPEPGMAPIEYVASPAAPLAAPSAAFDAVTCQQGLQFFPDRPAALAEMRRVLKPGGRLAAATWNLLGPIPNTAFDDRARELSLELPPRADFGSHPADLLAAVAAARFREVRSEPHTLLITFSSVDELRQVLNIGSRGELLAAISPDQREDLLAAWRTGLERYLRPDGSVQYDTTANIVTATK